MKTNRQSRVRINKICHWENITVTTATSNSKTRLLLESAISKVFSTKEPKLSGTTPSEVLLSLSLSLSLSPFSSNPYFLFGCQRNDRISNSHDGTRMIDRSNTNKKIFKIFISFHFLQLSQQPNGKCAPYGC